MRRREGNHGEREASYQKRSAVWGQREKSEGGGIREVSGRKNPSAKEKTARGGGGSDAQKKKGYSL